MLSWGRCAAYGTAIQTVLNMVKEESVIELHITTKICFLEKKYQTTDPRSNCPWGLEKIEMSKCGNCRWLVDDEERTRDKLLTGRNVIRLAKFLESEKDGYEIPKQGIEE